MSEDRRHAGAAAGSITPDTIREFTPPTAVRGYDRDTVDGFLREVAAKFELAVNDVAVLERRVLELETVSDREHAVGAALVVAQQTAGELRSKAEKDAEAIRMAAEAIRMAAAADAESLRATAKKEADSIVLEARREAKKIDEEAAAKRLAFEREPERLRSLREATRQDLSDFLTQALNGLQEPGEDHRAEETLESR